MDMALALRNEAGLAQIKIRAQLAVKASSLDRGLAAVAKVIKYPHDWGAVILLFTVREVDSGYDTRTK